MWDTLKPLTCVCKTVRLSPKFTCYSLSGTGGMSNRNFTVVVMATQHSAINKCLCFCLNGQNEGHYAGVLPEIQGSGWYKLRCVMT